MEILLRNVLIVELCGNFVGYCFMLFFFPPLPLRVSLLLTFGSFNMYLGEDLFVEIERPGNLWIVVKDVKTLVVYDVE